MVPPACHALLQEQRGGRRPLHRQRLPAGKRDDDVKFTTEANPVCNCRHCRVRDYLEVWPEGLHPVLTHTLRTFIQQIIQALAEQAAGALRQGLVERCIALARLRRELLPKRLDRIARGEGGRTHEPHHQGNERYRRNPPWARCGQVRSELADRRLSVGYE